MTSLTFHHDPGHGWLAVTIGQAAQVGLRVSDFSSWSYRSGGTLYLEEDCDAPKYLAAYRAKFQTDPSITERCHNGDAFIRALPRVCDPQPRYVRVSAAAAN